MEWLDTTIVWAKLPEDIRLMILETLLHTPGRKFSRLAVVSREWQTILERHSFARLRLTSSCLGEFASKTQRNRHLVRYIWFCLELEEFDCDSALEATHMLSQNDENILASGFQTLFSTLSTWEPDSRILLDISVYSPSDLEHWLRYLPLSPDVPPNERGRYQGALRPLLPSERQYKNDWTTGSEDCRCPLDVTLQERFGTIGNPESLFDTQEREERWWQGLPLVPAIAGLLLRQQTRRQWYPVTLAHMCSRLPRLNEIYYEPWLNTETHIPVLLYEGKHLPCFTPRCYAFRLIMLNFTIRLSTLFRYHWFHGPKSSSCLETSIKTILKFSPSPDTIKN